MLTPTVPLFRKRSRPAKRKAAPAPPPVALTLVSAVYDHSTVVLTLQFDRAIDIAGLVGTAIVVNDGFYAQISLNAVGAASLIGPATLQVHMIFVGPYIPIEEKMTATAMSGIVAVDDGGTWDGVTNLTLPFP
jgi:hypothetical protein